MLIRGRGGAQPEGAQGTRDSLLEGQATRGRNMDGDGGAGGQRKGIGART